MKHKAILTTGHIASICRCSHDTVKRWLETDQLRGHRLTPHGQWRVLPGDLLEFMERQGLPVEDEARATLGLSEDSLPIKEYLYCWEFHERNKTCPIVGDRNCQDCLVFKTKTKECFILRQHAGHQQVFCGGSCDECPYYQYIAEVEVPRQGEDIPEA